MAKSVARKPEPRSRQWKAALTSVVVQQILALLVLALGVITLLALLRVTTGRWADAWVRFLRYLLGWGAYPAAVAILLAGLTWLQHHLDRPVHLRWRPIVGAELVLISLLGLTHLLAGQHDPWALISTGWGGGLVGWAITVLLKTYLGLPAAVVLLVLLALVGLGLAFDVTLDDLKRLVANLRQPRTGRGAMARPSGERTWAAGSRPGHARPELGQVVHRAATERTAPLGPAAERPATRPSEPMAVHAAPSGPAVGSARPAPPPARATVPAATVERRPPPRPMAATPAAASQPAPVPPARRSYELPPLGLLNEPAGPSMSDAEIRAKSRIIEETLAQFGLPVEVTEVRVGPTVTQFGIKPGFVERGGAAERKVRVNQIAALASDLTLALSAPRVRVEAPVPGRAVVGIEVPNSQIQTVGLREVLESDEFRRRRSPLTFALGRDVAGEPVVADLAKMPHLLIAGTTGSGKSVCIKAITTCLIFSNTPDQLRLVMIDPKMVELARFNGLPHLYGRAEVDLERIVKVLRWVAAEMDERYRRFAAATARNLEDYNRLMEADGAPPLPRIVVLVDELADLMMLAPDEVERTICRIAQMARATGIHLVVATQRPSVDVVTGLIKANFPARISFATASQTDSRVILDMPGAETLLGKGDMLYLAADAGHPARVQGCYVWRKSWNGSCSSGAIRQAQPKRPRGSA